MNPAINEELNIPEDVKCIAFDFDGTMVNSKDLFVKIFNQLAQKHKFLAMTQENMPEIRKLSIKERFKYLGVPMYKLPYLSAVFLNLYNKSAHEISIVKGIREVIYNLHRNGYKLAIISSNSRKNVDHFLENHQITCISHIHCSSNIFGKDKMIRKFLQTYKFNSDEVIYVGDEQRDIEASKKNNLKILWVNWGYDTLDAVIEHQPDYIINKPEEILKIFNITS